MYDDDCRLVETRPCARTLADREMSGTGSLAALHTHDLSGLWAPLIIGGMGIGGIFVPSIIIVQMV